MQRCGKPTSLVSRGARRARPCSSLRSGHPTSPQSKDTRRGAVRPANRAPPGGPSAAPLASPRAARFHGSMRLRVLLFAALRERAGASALELDDLPDGLDVAGLKRELERRLPELGSLESARGVLGTRYVGDDAALPEAGEIALLPPVSGGNARQVDYERGVFELSAAPLDPAAYHARVCDPSCGAVVL